MAASSLYAYAQSAAALAGLDTGAAGSHGGSNVFIELFEKDIQAGITVNVQPHPVYMETRTATIISATAAAKQARSAAAIESPTGHDTQPHYTRIIWLPHATTEAYRIRRGDALWEDTLLSPSASATAQGGADQAYVFASFAGHAAVLPRGYLMQWSYDGVGNMGQTAGTAQYRAIVNARTLEPVDSETATAVIRAAYARRNRHQRFAGFSLSDHTVRPSSIASVITSSGVASLISGTFSRKNDSGETLLRDMLVCLVCPGEGYDYPLFTTPMSLISEPKARLAIYSPSNVAAHALCGRGLARLLRDDEVGVPTSVVYLEGGPEAAMESAANPPMPSKTSVQLDQMHAVPQRRTDEARRMSHEDAYALRLLHAMEAASMWAVMAYKEHEAQLAADPLLGSTLTPGLIFSRNVGPHAAHTRLLRLALSQALAGTTDTAASIAESDAVRAYLEDAFWYTGTDATADDAERVDTVQGAFWGMRQAMRALFRSMEQTDMASMGGDGTTGAIGLVVDASEPNEPVRIKMF